MFASSTQLKFWTFSGNTELGKLRSGANEKYIEDHGNDIAVSIDCVPKYVILRSDYTYRRRAVNITVPVKV